MTKTLEDDEDLASLFGIEMDEERREDTSSPEPSYDVVIDEIKVGFIKYRLLTNDWLADWRGEQWLAGSLRAAQGLMRSQHTREQRAAAAALYIPTAPVRMPLLTGRRWFDWLRKRKSQQSIRRPKRAS